MENEVQGIQINSYSKVWRMEHTIYSIGTYILPVPICPTDLLYFGGSLAGVLLLCRVLPIVHGLPFLLKYFGIPYGLTVFFRKMKLDGKNPIRFFYTYCKYMLFVKNKYFERFKGFQDKGNSYKMEWICSVRYHRR